MTASQVSAAVESAAERLKGMVTRTRVIYDSNLSSLLGLKVYLKMEHEQRTGAFKLRGAHNKLSQLAGTTNNFTVVTSSTGNHGLACLDAMQKYGIKGKIIVPKIVTLGKKKKLEEAGADLLLYGTDAIECENLCRKMAAEDDSVIYIPPYNDVNILAGQGTIGVEMLEDIPDLEVVFVSVGGGGLMAGIAGYLKHQNSNVKIVGCQPANSPVMIESIKAGDIIDYESSPTLSEGTAGGIEVGTVTFPICRDLVDHWSVLSEEDIKWGVRYMWEQHGAAVEGSAGLALAALRDTAKLWKGKTVCVLLCGGNIGKEALDDLLKD